MLSNVVPHKKKGEHSQRVAQRAKAHVRQQVQTIIESVRTLKEATTPPPYEVELTLADDNVCVSLIRPFGFYNSPSIRQLGLLAFPIVDSSSTQNYLFVDEEFIPVNLGTRNPNKLLQTRRAVDELMRRELICQQKNISSLLNQETSSLDLELICTGLDRLNVYTQSSNGLYQRQAFNTPDIKKYT